MSVESANLIARSDTTADAP